MSQQAQSQSAKRMRSNTSNEFTPQTAPALRTRPPQLASNALYAPSAATVYNAAAAAAAAGFAPDVDYGSYVAAAQHSAAAAYPAAPYTEPYDPHPHANSYTIAYGQPPPPNYGASHAGYYSPSIVASTQDGTYSPVTRQSASTGPDSYSPSPIPGTSAGTTPFSEIQGHTAAPVPPQYGDAYGSQQPVHPASHQPPPLAAYAEPTLASQFSPAPLEPPPPPPQQQPDAHTGQEMPDLPSVPEHDDQDSDEDAQGETADEAEASELEPPAPRYNPNQNPSLHPRSGPHDEPAKAQETKCACKKGRGKKKACTSCACSKYGRKCGKLCSCGSACGNPFQDLTAFFGPPEKFPKPCDANACFATWLSNQPNIEELDLDLMVDMLLYDDASWASIRGHAKTFKDWEDKWLKAKNSKSKKVREDRERLEFELLRGALGNCNADDFHGYWYSFCKGHWVPMDHWEHCRECKACAPSSEWHCEQHGRCTTNRICSTCSGAATASYPDAGPYAPAP